MILCLCSECFILFEMARTVRNIDCHCTGVTKKHVHISTSDWILVKKSILVRYNVVFMKNIWILHTKLAQSYLKLADSTNRKILITITQLYSESAKLYYK